MQLTIPRTSTETDTDTDMPRESPSTTWRWGLLSIVFVWIGACIPLTRNIGYYFVDDSQVDMYGKLWEIGARIMRWDWSFVNPQAWQAGNYLAEGYWGVFSPFLWVFGLVAHALPNALVTMTGLKMVLFALAALGIFLLARSFGSRAPLAMVAATCAPLAGFTLYMDAAAWMNGFTAWALTPLAWWSLREFVLGRRGILIAVATIYSVVSINYVHATLAVGVIALATGVEAIVARNRPAIRSALLVGVVWGLSTIVIHLPGLLISPASGRESGLDNDGFLVANLSGYATSVIGATATHVEFFGSPSQNFANAPLMYIAWFLPLFALVRWRKVGPLLSASVSLCLVSGFFLLATMGPSELGPLRFPIRVMPYLTVALLVLLSVLLTHAGPVTRRRFGVMIGIVALSAVMAFFQSPWYQPWIVLSATIASIGLVVSAAVLRRDDRSHESRWKATSFVLIGITFVILFIQHVPVSAAPLPNYRVPTAVAAHQQPLSAAVGDTLVVGNPADDSPQTPATWEETTIGNLWYLNDASVQNLYSAVYNTGYNSTTCMNYFGATCPELYAALFETKPETGALLVDLLGVSTVHILKNDVPAREWAATPEGWSVVTDTELVRTIVRDTPVAPAGGVVWSEPGTEIEMVAADEHGASFRVSAVPAGGGTVALSRIPWPGYEVTGGELSEHLTDGFLMTVDIPASAAGQVVTVDYRIPGQALVLISLLLIPVTGAAAIVGRRRGWFASKQNQPVISTA